MQRPAKFVWLIGGIFNVLLLLVPVALVGMDALATAIWPLTLMLLLATIFYAADLSAPNPPQADNVADRRARRLALATGITILVVLWASVYTCVAHPAYTSPATILCGSAMIIAGATLRRLAINQLGASFVTEVIVRADQKLIRNGVFSVIRHPSEAGLLLASFGAAVFAHSVLAAAICACVLLPVVLTRIAMEDRCLAIAFGTEFTDYRRRVKRWIPLVL